MLYDNVLYSFGIKIQEDKNYHTLHGNYLSVISIQKFQKRLKSQ